MPTFLVDRGVLRPPGQFWILFFGGHANSLRTLQCFHYSCNHSDLTNFCTVENVLKLSCHPNIFIAFLAFLSKCSLLRPLCTLGAGIKVGGKLHLLDVYLIDFLKDIAWKNDYLGV